MELTEHEAADDNPGPLTGLIAREEFDEVLSAMASLSTQAQQVLTMRFLEDRSYEAIAAELGHTIHQARSICHKAVVRLRGLVLTGRSRATDRKSRDV